MRLTGLSFDSIPELNVPLRFFLVAPVFAILASLLIIEQGSVLWLSRWLPASLAITHLFVLGVMVSIMFGSLFQVMPVLCGAPIKIGRPALILLQTGLVSGTLMLSAAFMGWTSFTVSMVLLGLSLGYFVLSLISVLIKNAAGQQTRIPILLSVLFLAVLLLAGIGLLSGYLTGVAVTPGKSLTHVHAGAGLFGWVLLLMMAVSFQVIPMFHVTPVFPSLWRHGLVSAVVAGLIAMVVVQLNQITSYPVTTYLALTAILYALISLDRLWKRKRKLPDTVISYWQFSFVCLIVSAVLMITLPLFPVEWQVKLEIFLALLFGLGFIIGVMQGMLLKIVPFLINLHLQNVAMQNPAGMMLLPDHYSLISRKQCRVQFRFYLCVIAAITLSFFLPQFTALIGVTLILNWIVIAFNLGRASHQYRSVRSAMLAAG